MKKGRLLERVVVELGIARKRLIEFTVEEETLTEEQLQTALKWVTRLHKMLGIAKEWQGQKVVHRKPKPLTVAETNVFPKQESVFAEEAKDDGTDSSRRKKRDNRSGAATNDSGGADSLG